MDQITAQLVAESPMMLAHVPLKNHAAMFDRVVKRCTAAGKFVL